MNHRSNFHLYKKPRGSLPQTTIFSENPGRWLFTRQWRSRDNTCLDVIITSDSSLVSELIAGLGVEFHD